MAATRCAASAAASTRACCGSFKVGGGVEAGCQGLLQIRVGLGFFSIGLRLAGGCLPAAVLRHIDHVAIGQLQGYFTAQACQDLFAHEQTFAFEHLALEAVERNGKYLANKAFYDGDDSAHKTGSGVGAVKSLNIVKQCFDLEVDNLTKYCRHKFGLFHYGITDMPNY